MTKPNPFTVPSFPADLAEIIDIHRNLFGGWVMVDPDPDDPDGGGPDDPDGGGPDDGEKLGESGLKTLQKERSKRKDLEKEVNALKAFQTQFTAAVSALTGADTGKAKPEEAMQQLIDRVDNLTHTNLVERVAREAKITEEDDIALLRKMSTEDEIRALAARLKPSDKTDADDTKTKDRRPRPDRSTGHGGGDNPARPGSVTEVMEARRKAREAKQSK